MTAGLPRPRLVVAAATRRARGDAPLPAGPPGRPGPGPQRRSGHPGRGRGGPRGGGGALGARPREVVFTATGTEAVNTAVCGRRRPGVGAGLGRGHVVTTAVEHSAVLESCRARRRRRHRRRRRPRAAACDADDVLAAMPARHGARQRAARQPRGRHHPDRRARHRRRGPRPRRARPRRRVRRRRPCPPRLRRRSAPTCARSPAHKLGGPKGAAALLIRRGRAPPAAHRRRRAGARPARRDRGRARDRRVRRRRGRARRRPPRPRRPRPRAQTTDLVAAALAVPGVTQLGDPDGRLPHLVCLAIAGVEAEPVLLGLDQRGVAVHSGSSCSCETLEPSPVLAAMGVDADRSLRPSVGWSTTDADVAAFVAAFSEVVGKMRALRAPVTSPRRSHCRSGGPRSVGCAHDDWSDLAAGSATRSTSASPPVAITFCDDAPAGVDPFDAPMPTPTRTTAAPVASRRAACSGSGRSDRTFSTVADDHANCSVGSVTHGFRTLDEVAGNADVADARSTPGWVTMDIVPEIPVVRDRPGTVTYGPLADTPVDPDVVLLRINGKQLMVLADALPGLRIEGKPQCHIVAVAKEEGEVAASVGCALSRRPHRDARDRDDVRDPGRPSPRGGLGAVPPRRRPTRRSPATPRRTPSGSPERLGRLLLGRLEVRAVARGVVGDVDHRCRSRERRRGSRPRCPGTG